MMAYNLTVKGYANGVMQAPPAVTLIITSIISMVEPEAILTPMFLPWCLVWSYY